MVISCLKRQWDKIIFLLISSSGSTPALTVNLDSDFERSKSMILFMYIAICWNNDNNFTKNMGNNDTKVENITS